MMLQVNREFLGGRCGSLERKTPHNRCCEASEGEAKEDARHVFQGQRHIDLLGAEPEGRCTVWNSVRTRSFRGRVNGQR